MQLKQQTIQLIEECDMAVSRFYRMRELDKAPDFFAEVKPHADQIRSQLQQYQQNMERWIETERPKHVRIQQIDHAVDAMEQFIVQSFYKETSKKRFIQSVQSVHYTFSSVLRYLEEGEADAK